MEHLFPQRAQQRMGGGEHPLPVPVQNTLHLRSRDGRGELVSQGVILTLLLQQDPGDVPVIVAEAELLPVGQPVDLLPQRGVRQVVEIKAADMVAAVFIHMGVPLQQGVQPLGEQNFIRGADLCFPFVAVLQGHPPFSLLPTLCRNPLLFSSACGEKCEKRGTYHPPAPCFRTNPSPPAPRGNMRKREKTS